MTRNTYSRISEDVSDIYPRSSYKTMQLQSGLLMCKYQVDQKWPVPH